jgi:hypothetical protein
VSGSTEPSVEQRLRGVEQFVRFADTLKVSGSSDFVTVGWAITALFYSAVHEIRAYLKAKHGLNVASHEEMRHVEQRHPELQRTKGIYDLLKQESHSARYYLNERFTWSDYEILRKKATAFQAAWRSKTLQCAERP